MAKDDAAVDRVARAIYECHPASVSEGDVSWKEALEDWPEHVREARKLARAAIRAMGGEQ